MAKFRTLSQCKTGVIGIMFALTLIPILGLIGLAIDWGYTTQTKAGLDAAADSAAMAAATRAAADYANTPGITLQNAENAGILAGNSVFQTVTGAALAYAQPVPGSGSSYTTVIPTQPGQFQATVQYRAAAPSLIGHLFNVGSYDVAGTSVVNTGVEGTVFTDIQFMLDTSDSMGVVASPADMPNLANIIKTQYPASEASWGQNGDCAFACHFTPVAGSTDPDFYSIAEFNNIELRIDALKLAVQTTIQSLMQNDIANQYRVGVYTFNTTLTDAYNLNGDLAAALPILQSLTPPLEPSGAVDTYMPDDMQSMLPYLGTGGDGSSAASPQKVLILITDGVADYDSPAAVNSTNPSGRVVEPINVSQCAAIKQNGVRIMVLNTIYYPVYSDIATQTLNTTYAQFVQPIMDNGAVANALQSCASSPSDYYTATDAASIASAMEKMIQSVMLYSARFTK